MRKSFYLSLAGSVVLLASCGKQDVEVLPEGLIAFRQAGLVSSFSAMVDTKASVVDDASLASSGFNVTCTTGSVGSETQVWNNVAFTKSGSYYVAGGDGKWWPATNPSYHFYGANAAITFNAGGPTVEATNATDVVCAYMPSPAYKTPNTLEFKHIFARITDVTMEAATGYTISGISVTITPKTGGTYNLRTGSGQTDGTGWSSLTTGSATGIANATPGTKSNDLYLVPGTYTLTASWTATRGEYTQTFTGRTCDISVIGGKCNTITANFTGDATQVMFDVSVTDWGSNTIAIGTFPTVSAEDFEINGDFTVDGSGTKVRFAKGNLQAVIGTGISDYRATASSWKFADNQWDYVGNAAGNTSFAVGSTVDLFGWVGASASYDSYGLCTNASTKNAYYGTSASDALKTDWGSIPGVISACGTGWRTLTSAEWNYVFSTRASGATVNGTSNARYTHATINTDGTGVNGMILFPDGVTIAAGEATTWGAINDNSSWATKCTTSQWSALESKGCVFLPAAGRRYGTSVYNAGSFGSYWSSSVNDEYGAYYVYFGSGYLNPQGDNVRCRGFSVRLAR